MNTRRRTLLALPVALPMALSLPAARAHGNAPHHGGPAAVMKEQKPWGIAGDAKDVRRTVTVRMTDDMKLSPNHIEVRQGETLRIRAVNAGAVMHEIVLGTREELAAHAELMKKHPGMQHEEPYMAHVPPGQQGDLVWRFNRAGDFEFACLIPGHFEAGMRGTLRVKAAGQPVVQVWKDPNCGCCQDWVDHLQAEGFDVQTFDTGNTAMRRRLQMPERLGSCHTALVAGYVIEGHVPAREIRRLLAEKPQAIGLTVPGMPVGSPGMDGAIYGDRRDPHDVLLVQRDGSTRVFQSYFRR